MRRTFKILIMFLVLANVFLIMTPLIQAAVPGHRDTNPPSPPPLPPREDPPGPKIPKNPGKDATKPGPGKGSDKGKDKTQPVQPKPKDKDEKEDKNRRRHKDIDPFDPVDPGQNQDKNKKDIDTGKPAEVTDKKEVDVIKVTEKPSGRKYEDPKELMSRSEFLMNMIQTKKIIESRPWLANVQYYRWDKDEGKYQAILTEPIENSGYQEYMGQLGLDAGATDIVINHSAYGQTEMMVNPNVIELYLAEAYSKGLISINDLEKGEDSDAASLINYLTYYFDKKEGNPKEERRVRWDPTYKEWYHFLAKFENVGKMWEEDNAKAGQYPEAYQEKWRKVDGIPFDFEPVDKWDKRSAVWGNGFTYILNGTKLDPKGDYNATEMTKLSNRITMGTSVSVDIRRRKPIIIDKENGFAFFTNENISVIDAYVYAHKFLLTSETESTLSKDTIDAVNSAYGVNTSAFTPDQADSVNFLIAKGILNGDDPSILHAAQLPLTNEKAVDLLYRMAFPDSRKVSIPAMTETDKAMLDKGFGKARVHIDSNAKDFPEVYVGNFEDNMNSGEPMSGFKPESTQAIDIIKKKDNKGEYQLLLVRYPELKDWKIADNGFRLAVDDSYNIPIPHQEIPNETSTLEDGSGQKWRVYTVHRDTISKLRITTQITRPKPNADPPEDEKKTFSIGGISGEGLYWFDLEDPAYGIRKVSFDNIKLDLDNPEDVKKASADATFFMTKDPKKGVEFLKKVLEIRDRLSMYRKENDNFNITSLKNYNRVLMPVNKDIKDVQTAIKETNQLVAYGNLTFEQANRVLQNRYGINDSDILWERPSYADADQGLIQLLSYTEDGLKNLLYGGEPLVRSNGAGDYEINKDNTLIKSSGLTDNLLIEKGQGKNKAGIMQDTWKISLKPKTKDYKTEMAKFMRNLTSSSASGEKQIGAYAKIYDNGKETTMVAKSELLALGITALSDKVLYNKDTGQRAFLNTDDNVTMIGNNITHYEPDTMMVYAFGAAEDPDNKDKKSDKKDTRDESKIFYNLDMILELINNTNIVTNRAGKDVYVGIDGDKFERVKIINKENTYYGRDGSKFNPTIDITYLYSNSKEQNRMSFVSLSALAGITSNFIYYKNRVGNTNVDALVVYKPEEGAAPYSEQIDNTLKAQMLTGSANEETMFEVFKKTPDVPKMVQSMAGSKEAEALSSIINDETALDLNAIKKTPNSYNKIKERLKGTTDLNAYTDAVKDYKESVKAKTALIRTLFLGSSTEDDDIFQPNYEYKVFVLNKGGNDVDTRLANITNLLTTIILANNGTESEKHIKALESRLDGKLIASEGTIDVGSDYFLKSEELYQKDREKYMDESGIMIRSLDVATSKAQAEGKRGPQYDLLVHEPTGNLYFKLYDADDPSSKTKQINKFQYFFENNIWYNEKDNEIFFKPRHLYENTPRNMIPLEVYGMHDGYFGAMFISGGHKMINFGLPNVSSNGTVSSYTDTNYKLAFYSLNNSAAIETSKAKEGGAFNEDKGVGMFTRISGDPIEISKELLPDTKPTSKDLDDTVKSLGYPAVKIDGASYKSYSESEKRVDLKGNTRWEELVKILYGKSIKALSDAYQPPDKTPNARTIYDAIYRAVIRPDEMDMKFLKDSMAHSWFAVIDDSPVLTMSPKSLQERSLISYNFAGWGKGNNPNNSYKGFTKDEEIIFLTVGKPQLLKAIRNEGNLPNVISKGSGLFAVKEKATGNNTLSGEASRWIAEAKTNSSEENKVVSIDSYEDLVNVAYDKEGKLKKIYFLPSLSIPFGSTLVDRYGKLNVIPNATYREEDMYATNAVNGLIFRMTLNSDRHEGRTFLYELPKGSVVDFGGGVKLIKASPKQKGEGAAKLKWNEMITSPSSVSSQMNENQMSLVPRPFVSDYAFLDAFLRGYGNRVAITYSTTGKKVPLKSIIGKGIYNVPHKDLLTEVINAPVGEENKDKADLTGKHFMGANGNSFDVWTNDFIKNTSKVVQVTNIMPKVAEYDSSSKEMKFNGKNIALQELLLYLPPTIEVELTKNGTNDSHYRVKAYHDIREFNVDRDDSYVQYLKDRDTNAEELLKDFEQVNVENMDGRKFVDYTRNKLSKESLQNAVTFVEKVGGFLFLLLAFLVWVMYVFLRLPITQNLIIKAARIFGVNWDEGYGYGRDNESIPTFRDTLVLSMVFATVSILLYNGILILVIQQVFKVFKYFVDKF